MKTSRDGFFAQASKAFAIVGIVVLFLAFLLYACGARINRTHSLAKGLYWVVAKTPSRGDIVTFWPSDCPEMRLARDRGYIIPGVYNKTNGVGYGLLMKRFFGLPGDVVSESSASSVVDGGEAREEVVDDIAVSSSGGGQGRVLERSRENVS